MKLIKVICLNCGESIEVPEDLVSFERTDFKAESVWSWVGEDGHCHFSRVKKAKKKEERSEF